MNLQFVANVTVALQIHGLLVGDASNLGFTKTSKPGAYFLAPHAPAVIISYAEILFDRAEAAARGFTTENAADLYTQAIPLR